jgi:hypothetical protein
VSPRAHRSRSLLPPQARSAAECDVPGRERSRER